jgi:hypothetical protein
MYEQIKGIVNVYEWNGENWLYSYSHIFISHNIAAVIAQHIRDSNRDENGALTIFAMYSKDGMKPENFNVRPYSVEADAPGN